MRTPAAIVAALALSACASTTTQSGFLTNYEGLQKREDTVRAAIAGRRDADALKAVRRIAVEPTVFADGADIGWMSAGERELLLRELDAQLCFELTERYELTAEAPEARVRAAVTAARPTGRVGSVASAAADFFIPGPIGLRVPGTLGALAAEAEMLDPAGQQLAAISWNRVATPVGTDSPSLSRIGDALQFAEPFADEGGKVMAIPEAPSRKIESPDPCAAYGPRFRPEGFLTKLVTGLYAPETSGAKKAEDRP